MSKTLLLAAVLAASSSALCEITAAQSPENPIRRNTLPLLATPDRNSPADSSSTEALDAASSPADGAAPDPAAPRPAAGRDGPRFAPHGIEGWPPFSRIAVGAGVGPLGIGIRGAVVVTEYFDARVDGSLFFYRPRFQINGFDANADFHLASVTAKLDWYPTNSVWRVSPGLLLYNGNQFSTQLTADGGTSFDLNGKTYYSADPNKVPGAAPLSGNVDLGLNRNKAAFTITGGFGRFIPRSHRHWSFPDEFGVAFTGAPTLDINLSGWVCTDKAQTQCSNIANPANPVGVQFHDSLNTALVRWRKSLSAVSVYPIFSTGVMYSFDLK